MNCGAHHDIAECERCSQYYIDYENDDIMLCDNCKECRNNGVVFATMSSDELKKAIKEILLR